jgi:chromosomal replication initiator protein
VDATVDTSPDDLTEQHVDDAEQLWKAVGQVLRAQVSEAVWLSTFQDVVPERLEEGELTVTVPSATARERIEGRYLPLVRDALTEVGRADIALVLNIRAEPAAPDLDDVVDAYPLAGPPVSIGGHSPPSGDGLNARYSFETFVPGPSNRFAHAAALRVAETPARSYNPLFIHGSSGLGKTHLLHAIGHYVSQNYREQRVRYVSTETFLNEYIDMIRHREQTAFKRRYRDVDVLLIDDIQIIENKEGFQEEFFHTFNSLHGSNKQIVISSDRGPDAIAKLEDRLRSRFKWGLITDIQPPDLETRLAILRNKAERDGTPVPPDVLELIATHITNNIRELEGALIRVTAYASLNHEPITIGLAHDVLGDLLIERVARPPTPEVLMQQIADFFGMSIDQLAGQSRQRPLVTARQIGMYVFREVTDLSYPAIARYFGGRDHTTVMHAVEKIQRLMSERQQIYEQVTELVQLARKPA